MIPIDNSRRVPTLVFIILFTLIGVDISVSSPTFFSGTDTHGIEDEAQKNHIDRLVSSMDDTELLGQIFLLAYTGTSPSDQILSWIEEKQIGGVKIFGWNAENLDRLSEGISTMQRVAARNRLSIPLFVATDQEGGWVRHVKSSTSQTPGNMAIGATGLPHDAFWTGYHIAKELKTVGINMNFAPTVDVYSNLEAHVIGPRSFSESPVETANLAVAYYMGMEKAGVISTAKHFPGHGNAAEDSHGSLPRIDTPFSVLWDRELLPYRFLIKRDIPAIMSGHLSFPIIEKDIPASLSPYFLEEVLRERMGFSGIVITDDMRMYGATNTDQ
ncbi:MAG: glycoside hydrolase family 3 N-terminal domain-containing protein, partial [Spirochaetia bacterium]